MPNFSFKTEKSVRTRQPNYFNFGGFEFPYISTLRSKASTQNKVKDLEFSFYLKKLPTAIKLIYCKLYEPE